MMRLAFLFALALLSSSATAQPAGDLEARMNAAFERVRGEQAIPALAVGVVDGGEIVYARVLGAPQDARFRAASISKLMTAQALMRLVEAGDAALDDDVGRYVQAFAGRGVTLRQLLTHTSGLADGPRPRAATDAAAVAPYVEALAASASLSEPGAAWRYTDSEYNLLGGVITAVSGRPYADFVAETVLAPAGADGASMFPTDRAGVLAPHLNYVVALPAPSRPYDIAFAPSEGLVTDIASLTRWMAATLNQEPALLQPTSYAMMLAPQHGRHAALGWQVSERDGRRVAQHGGSFTGWSALVLTYPDQRRGFVVLTNAHDAPRWEIVAVAEAVLEGRAPQFPAPPWGRRLAFWGVIIVVAALTGLGAWRLRRRAAR